MNFIAIDTETGGNMFEMVINPPHINAMIRNVI